MINNELLFHTHSNTLDTESTKLPCMYKDSGDLEVHRRIVFRVFSNDENTYT